MQLSIYWKQTEANPLKLLLMSVDKMDQLKTIFPRFASMQQPDMGRPVCKDACMQLSGIDKHALHRARERVLSTRPITPGALAMMPAFLDGRNANKYLSARAWLTAYAEGHADYNPMNGEMLLPAGHRCFYYNMYRESCESASSIDPASQATFLEM